MNVGCCASVSTIQNAMKWLDIPAQCCACVASRKKDAKLYTARVNLNVDDTNGSNQNGLQDTFLCSLPFTKRYQAGENPRTLIHFFIS